MKSLLANLGVVSLLGVGLGVGVVGCSSMGLSARESNVDAYPAMAQPPVVPYASTNVSPVGLRFPLRVTVVQVGETAAPEAMLNAFRARPELFGRVQTVPADPDPAHSENKLMDLRSNAIGLGTDYLLIFGGSIDHGRQGTPLKALDWTVVGAFVVPSTNVEVNGKAAGSLIDAHTGQLVVNFSSDSRGRGMAASAFAADIEHKSVEATREDLIRKLTTDVIDQLQSESRSGPTTRP